MLCDTIMMDMFIYTFVQIHRMDSTKSEPEVNYELWVITMRQCRFILGNKCNPLVSGVD